MRICPKKHILTQQPEMSFSCHSNTGKKGIMLSLQILKYLQRVGLNIKQQMVPLQFLTAWNHWRIATVNDPIFRAGPT